MNLRFVQIAAFTIAALLCQRAVGMDRAHFLELNKQGRELAQKKDWNGLRSVLIEIGKELPGMTPTYLLRLASVEARLGNMDAALSSMRDYAAMGLSYDVSQDDDLKPLVSESGWQSVAETMRRNTLPINRTEEVCALSVPDLMPEDLTFDSSGEVIVSSVMHHGLFRVHLPKDKTERCRPQQVAIDTKARLWPSLAVSYDSRRDLLWMSASAMPGFHTFPKVHDGKAALVAIDPTRGTTIRRFDLDSGAPGVLGDMSVAKDGTVYLTDSIGGGVYRVRGDVSRAKLEKIADGLFSPQTPVLARDGKRLFVAEYSLGVAVINLNNGQISYLEHPENVATTGLDGLFLDGSSLIGIQNGTDPERIMRFKLNASQTEIVSAEVIAQGPEIGEPTHVVSSKGWIYVMANVGWNKIDDHGELKKGQSFTPPLLVRFKSSEK